MNFFYNKTRIRSSIFGILALITVVFLQTKAWAETVSVWVYHDFPPYIVNADTKHGMSYDLAHLLSEMSNGKFQFEVEVLPRERLNQRIISGDPGIVLWVNNAWFGDKDKTKFLWSEPILHDQNAVISPADFPFDYKEPQTLLGMELICVRGHHYEGVEPLIQQGAVTRIDMNAEGHLIQYIASGRGRVAIVANSAAQYFVRELNLRDKIYFSPKSHSTYERYILVQPQMKALDAFLEAAMLELQQENTWGTVLGIYGLSN